MTAIFVLMIVLYCILYCSYCIECHNGKTLYSVGVMTVEARNVGGSPLLECEPKGSINLKLQDKCMQFNCREDSEKSLPEPSDADPEKELEFSLYGWEDWLQDCDAN